MTVQEGGVVAEKWERVDGVPFTPFCILATPQCGNLCLCRKVKITN